MQAFTDMIELLHKCTSLHHEDLHFLLHTDKFTVEKPRRKFEYVQFCSAQKTEKVCIQYLSHLRLGETVELMLKVAYFCNVRSV